MFTNMSEAEVNITDRIMSDAFIPFTSLRVVSQYTMAKHTKITIKTAIRVPTDAVDDDQWRKFVVATMAAAAVWATNYVTVGAPGEEFGPKSVDEGDGWDASDALGSSSSRRRPRDVTGG